MENRIRIAVISLMLTILIMVFTYPPTFVNVAIANTDNDAVIAETLEQIENPNPQAMEAYTQLTGQPDEYMNLLYESLNRLTAR